MADWIPKAMMRLVELSQLENDWDGYGSNPVDPLALGYAVQLLGVFAKPEWNVPEPHISPLSGIGAIEFEWDKPEMLVNFAQYGSRVLRCHIDGKTFTMLTLADLCKRLAEIPGWLTA